MKVFIRKAAIQEILIRRCKSQNWLAHKLELSSGYMSQLMDGSRNPSPKIRQRIMDNLPEHDFDDLFVIKKTGKK